MTIQNEREIAVYILIDIFEQKAYGNIMLRKTLNRNNAMGAVQKAFITEIVNGTLRNLIHIDYIINLYSKTSTEKMKPLILNVLRISVYQMKFMDKIPISAVCNEAVKLVKNKGLGGLSAFINGVLRNISRNLDNITYPDQEKEPIKFLSTYYSYPVWMIEHFLKELGIDKVKEMCKVNNKPPSVCICVNTLKTTKDNLIRIIGEEKVIAERDGMLYLKNVSNITKEKAFAEGLFHVMDYSSAMCVRELKPQAGDKVIDVCAAPGGKSFYAAYMMEGHGEILSLDIHHHKLNLINDGAERLGITIIQVKQRDGARAYDEDKGSADCVLIDAPCSGLGLLRKKPDIKYTKNAGDIKELQMLQRQILKSSSEYVKPGGRLVYSTCTISKEENSDNIDWFLENNPFKLDSKISILPQDYCDGFFIASMIRDDE